MTNQPIADPDAERAVLGAVLLRGDALDRVELEPEDFADARHRELFASMRRLRDRGTAIDPVTVADDLRANECHAVDGLPLCSSLVSGVVTADNVEHYVAIVSDKARLRRLEQAAHEVVARCRSGWGAEDAQAFAAARLAETWKRQPDSARGMDELVLDTWRHLAALNEQRGSGAASWGLRTGFEELDLLLGGIQPGVVTIVAGRPSMGKSSLARSIAESVVLAGKGVHVFSIEDSARSYTLRCLSDNARIDLHRLRGCELRKPEMTQLYTAAERLHQKRWLVDDTAGLSSAQVSMRTRKRLEENGTALVVVDYVQLMREQGAKTERENFERAAVGMQRLARECNVGLLLLSQLNRECEGRPDKRPMLSDLRETGVLEQIAETVIFLYRDDMYNPKTERPGEGEAIVRKNKNGRTGTVRLQWDGPTATYRPLERYRRMEAV